MIRLLILCSIFSSALFSHTFNLSVCALVKNEGPFLKEWIEFHRMIGVEHFYLYENGSSDNTVSVLKPYVEAGIVELFDWRPGVAPWFDIDSEPKYRGFAQFCGYQLTAFQDALKRAAGKSKWLAIIDVDEFIVSREGKNHLKEILRNCDDVHTIKLGWVIYGTSEYWDLPKDKPMIEALRRRPSEIWPGNHLTKCIIRPERMVRYCIHAPEEVKEGSGREVELKRDVIRINHYQYRGAKELWWKRFGKHYLVNRKMLDKFLPKNKSYENSLNVIDDPSALIYVSELRERLGYD